MLKKMAAFVREEEGQGMAEYGLILAGVAIVAVGAFTALGDQVEVLIKKVTTALK